MMGRVMAAVLLVGVSVSPAVGDEKVRPAGTTTTGEWSQLPSPSRLAFVSGATAALAMFGLACDGRLQVGSVVALMEVHAESSPERRNTPALMAMVTVLGHSGCEFEGGPARLLELNAILLDLYRATK